ncbi:hypothetical protein, partial [Saccharospirillum sp. MSK14-1]|uniref:hypothetical protein n=1 Tax=Saccharospirillum sp. MSK14-1 TaxID=1897632 RepID=UPI001E52CE83
MTMTNPLGQIFKKLNLIAYEHTSSPQLQLLSDVPVHLIDILSLSTNDPDSTFPASPYLENFFE